MQHSSFDVELQCTLSELCVDLFVVPALEDCSAILKSLAQLADTFPQAQALLGRLLAQNGESQDRSQGRVVSRLSVLSERFLYKTETAHSAVCLIAALANNNMRNQRRIIQNIVGAKINIDPTKWSRATSSSGAACSLYALTVPAAVTSTYRKWRRRQRELRNCRLPSGVPPAHDGIPMPCYCDDCLGAEQFLSTWQCHFRDLSRWTKDSNQDASANKAIPSLSTEDFFRVFLADYHVFTCTTKEIQSSPRESEISCVAGLNKRSSLIFYFVPPDDETAAAGMPPQFNALRHLSAIAIAAEIDVASAKTAIEHSTEHPKAYEKIGLKMLDTQQVILLTCIAGIQTCASGPDSGEAVCRASPEANHQVAEVLTKIWERDGDLVQCDRLLTLVNDDDNGFADSTRQVVAGILEFCGSDDHIPVSAFHRIFAGVSDGKETEPDESSIPDVHRWNCKVVMTALLSEQTLQVECFPTDGANSQQFSSHISSALLTGGSSSFSLSLLRLTDEALMVLLQRCRICDCDDKGIHADLNSEIYLRQSAFERKVGEDDQAEDVTENNPAENDSSITLPLSGLSSEAKRYLTALKSSAPRTCEDITTIAHKLAKVITSCNDRISYLSVARDKNLLRAAPEVYRAAAIARCRHCRDLLIQLGKKLALQMKALDSTVFISQPKLARVLKILHASISDTLSHSENFDPWETPDARVEKLHLDRRLWASGFPDAAYFQDTNKRQRANRKRQEQLSRKLLIQQRRSKDRSRAKQRTT